MVVVLGAGPAGSSAGIAALAMGSPVQLIERSHRPRHKVCGEFLTPGIEPLLHRLGVADRFHALCPSAIRRMELHFGSRCKASKLPEPGYGLSRYAFDQLLFRTAVERGASVAAASESEVQVVAVGRRSTTPRGKRLFGFKAHYRGPVDDAVQLFFHEGFYVGVNCIEAGCTNVCGLAAEDVLKRTGFDVDALLRRCLPLSSRLQPLSRSMEWLFTGPLEFRNRLRADDSKFYAGDALSFVDPFTGSGLLSAVCTGMLAGEYAACSRPVSEYLRVCQSMLEKPLGVASLLRGIARTRAAEYLITLVPGEVLFRWTRPGLLV